MRVGAHTVHATGGPMAAAFDCGACHVKPTGILDAGHIDNAFATVTFGTLASRFGAAPTFSRTTGTCSSTYCHGATIRLQEQQQPGSSPRGANVAPSWTQGPSQATCGTCHGLPPDTGMHWSHVKTGAIGCVLPCSWCHAGYQDWPSTRDQAVPDKTRHVDGVKDVIISPDAADGPPNAYTRINGWDAPSCHSVVACHGLMY
jgi:predicted CxxxxCH...CXXCH cytochrome family protein